MKVVIYKKCFLNSCVVYRNFFFLYLCSDVNMIMNIIVKYIRDWKSLHIFIYYNILLVLIKLITVLMVINIVKNEVKLLSGLLKL